MWTDRFKTVALRALPLAVLVGIAGAADAQWRVVQPDERQQTIRYAEMDVNGDGVVTRREWRGTRRAFNQADWNRDGVLSGNEVRLDTNEAVGTSGTVNRRTEFLRFDRNRDGILHPFEWTGIRSSFDVFDVNEDGVITEREYVAAEEDSRSAVPRQGVNRQAPEVIFVDANERWTRTGIFVNRGDLLLFDTQGLVQLSASRDDIAVSAGAQSGRHAANAPLPDALAGALIGRIGTRAPFGIGNQRQITAPETGELLLGVNDDHLADNHGGFRVRVVQR